MYILTLFLSLQRIMIGEQCCCVELNWNNVAKERPAILSRLWTKADNTMTIQADVT